MGGIYREERYTHHVQGGIYRKEVYPPCTPWGIYTLRYTPRYTLRYTSLGSQGGILGRLYSFPRVQGG